MHFTPRNNQDPYSVLAVDFYFLINFVYMNIFFFELLGSLIKEITIWTDTHFKK